MNPMKTISQATRIANNLLQKSIEAFTSKTCRCCETNVPFWKSVHNFGAGECLCNDCSDLGEREDQHPHSLIDLRTYQADTLLSNLLATTKAAIENGDWDVDGRCDPEFDIARAERYLNEKYPEIAQRDGEDEMALSA